MCQEAKSEGARTKRVCDSNVHKAELEELTMPMSHNGFTSCISAYHGMCMHDLKRLHVVFGSKDRAVGQNQDASVIGPHFDVRIPMLTNICAEIGRKDDAWKPEPRLFRHMFESPVLLCHTSVRVSGSIQSDPSFGYEQVRHCPERSWARCTRHTLIRSNITETCSVTLDSLFVGVSKICFYCCRKCAKYMYTDVVGLHAYKHMLLKSIIILLLSAWD